MSYHSEMFFKSQIWTLCNSLTVPAKKFEQNKRITSDTDFEQINTIKRYGDSLKIPKLI